MGIRQLTTVNDALARIAIGYSNGRKYTDEVWAEVKRVAKEIERGDAENAAECAAAAVGAQLFRWIPVGERLPEECGAYLVVIKSLALGVSTVERTRFSRYADGSPRWGDNGMDYCPTHWAPLPEPPEGT